MASVRPLAKKAPFQWQRRSQLLHRPRYRRRAHVRSAFNGWAAGTGTGWFDQPRVLKVASSAQVCHDEGKAPVELRASTDDPQDPEVAICAHPLVKYRTTIDQVAAIYGVAIDVVDCRFVTTPRAIPPPVDSVQDHFGGTPVGQHRPAEITGEVVGGQPVDRFHWRLHFAVSCDHSAIPIGKRILAFPAAGVNGRLLLRCRRLS